MANILFRSLTKVRISSLSGHCITIEPGKPQEVPEVMHAEVYAAGCVPVDSTSNDEPSVPQGEDRASSVMDAIHELIASDNADNFKKDGSPKVAAVEEVVGFAVTAAEVLVEFEKLSDIASKMTKAE